MIVTGVDGSETAVAAARRAAELASALSVPLHLISAYGRLEEEAVEVGARRIVVSNEGDAERLAARAAAELRIDFPTVAISSGAAAGKPGDALVQVADALDADLIVVGNKRVQGVSRVFGSIAREVAARARCDLLIVNTHPRG